VSSATLDLLVSADALTGVAIGSITVLAVIGWVLITHRPTPIGGLLLAGSVLVALAVTNVIPALLVVGMVLLAVAGWIPVHTLAASMLVSIPGAVAIGATLLDNSRPTLGGLAVAAIIVSGPLVASFDERYGESAISIPLIAVSMLGVFTIVADTDKAIVAAGAVVPWLVAGPPAKVAHLGRSGAFTSSGIVIWIAASGATSRPGALVAGVTALGILVSEPAIGALRSADSSRLDRLLKRGLVGATAILAVQAGIGLVMGQVVIGAELSTPYVVAIAGLVLFLVGVWAKSPEPDS
jgi:hypothetical protein